MDSSVTQVRYRIAPLDKDLQEFTCSHSKGLLFMEEQRLGDAAVGAIHEKKERVSFWWPETDTIEHARDAAKFGSVAFGLIAFGQLVVVGVAIFTGHRMIVEDYIFLFVTALFVYLAWRTYKRPTVLLNCIAFAWIGLLELGFKIIVMLAASNVNVAPLWMPILGTIAAVGGIRGSFAVRRFEAIAASAGAAVSS
jgi:hypothetical protein